MNKRAWWSAVALASLVSATGCGGDEGTQVPPQGTAGFAGAATAGTGVTAGTGTGFPAAGTSSTTGPVTCGTVTCPAPPMLPPGIPITLPPPCCTPTNECGSMRSGMCIPPLPPAPLCPPGPSFAGIMTRACCIQATQMCGIDGSALGMGCVSGSMLPGASSTPTKCDGTVVATPVAGAPATAGTGAAGTAAGGAGGASGAAAGAGGASGGAGGASGAAAGTGATAGVGGSAAGGTGGGAAGTAAAGTGAGGRGFP
jgi:hypothetical protein